MNWPVLKNGGEWHVVYAWMPVIIGEHWHWLEWVERREVEFGWDTRHEYRLTAEEAAT